MNPMTSTTPLRRASSRSALRALLSVWILFVCSVGYGLHPTAARAQVKVVATTPSLAALAKEVGGEYVDVTSLAGVDEDAHYVDPRPDFILQVSKADLLLANGLELEVGWLPELQKSARNPAVLSGADGYLEAASAIDPLEAGQSADRSGGDVHPNGNPHFLYDARRGAEVAVALGERLGKLDPAHADDYARRAAAASESLRLLAQGHSAKFESLADGSRTIVTYHASFPYLIDWLGLELAETIEPKPGVSPSPGHSAKVLKLLKSEGSLILQEAYQPTETSKKLSKLSGRPLVVIPGNPDFAEGETYTSYVDRIAEAVYEELADQ